MSESVQNDASNQPRTEKDENAVAKSNDTSSNASLPSGSDKIGANSINSDPAPEKSTASTRRPVTRSLSGRPAKRRIYEDNSPEPAINSADDADSDQPATLPATKKQKTVSAPKKKPTRKYSAAASQDETIASVQGWLPEQSPSASPSVPPAPPPVIATRIGTTRAMRATLPTPVPNLTKKSRGRRVPVRVVTSAGAEIITHPETVGGDAAPPSTDNSKEKRSYVCSVEGCGKCFHRGEHLKRHIRSIHTHEKPFKCTYPECDKNFNRHDNLLQHLKVHKQAQATAAMTDSAASIVLSDGQSSGKAKSKSKSSKSASSAGKGRKKRKSRKASSSEDEESDAEEDDAASGSEAEEEIAVSNLLSLRANSLKGAPTLIAPLHHNLTSSSSYTSTAAMPSLGSFGSMSAASTLVSGWGMYPTAPFSGSNPSFVGSKPYISPFAMSNDGSNDMIPHLKPYNPHSLEEHLTRGYPSHTSPFSLSKVYSAGVDIGATSYESAVNVNADTNGVGLGSGPHTHHTFHRHGHDHDMGEGEESFQSNMALSSLRSTTANGSTDGRKRDMNGSPATLSPELTTASRPLALPDITENGFGHAANGDISVGEDASNPKLQTIQNPATALTLPRVMLRPVDGDKDWTMKA